MDNVLKLINRWLIIFTILFVLINIVNRLTIDRYDVKGNIVIDNVKNEVFIVKHNETVTRTQIIGE